MSKSETGDKYAVRDVKLQGHFRDVGGMVKVVEDYLARNNKKEAKK